MSNRHRARRLTLQALCCQDVQGGDADEMIRMFLDDSREAPETVTDAKEMLREVAAQLQALDDTLKRTAKHWHLDRLALVDRNILRLACWELFEGETPFKVVITESLKLAQEFSSAESPRFVNGVLDAVAKEMRADMGRED